MRGHEPLIAMRMSRRAPDTVYIEAGSPTLMVTDWPKACPQFAHLSIADSESLTSVDLRCVVGLFAQVSGTEPRRLAAIVDACKEAGAKRVVGVLLKREPYRSDLIEVTDTEGVLTWQM